MTDVAVSLRIFAILSASDSETFPVSVQACYYERLRTFIEIFFPG